MNFQIITSGLDVQPMLDTIAKQPELWKAITIRQEYEGSAHHDTECIILRGPKGFSHADVQEDLSAIDYPFMDAMLPAITDLMTPLLKQMGVKELGRVMIVNLKAGGSIDQHVDEGAYAEHYERFHLVLESAGGNVFYCGDGAQWMKAGEVWWFNHRKPHWVQNHSSSDRLHIIFDAVLEKPVRVPEGAAPKIRSNCTKQGIVAISYDQGIEDVGELLQAHWEEVAKNKQIMILNPAHDMYRAMEQAGGLFILAAYEQGRMIGYSANFIHKHLHYADLIYAQNDLLFVHKDYRSSPIGLKLIRETEKAAKEKGARMMLWHAKQGTTLDKIMPRLKYGVQDIIYSREL